MKPARVSLLLSTVALLAAAILPAVGRGQERPVNVVMGDQFNNRVETSQLRGDVVVLVYAGRHGAEAAMELGRTLHTRFHPTAEGAEPNAWSTPELTFRFHYFAMRKMHLAMRANALVVFPGGFGTLDELFEILTLRQTGKMRAVPVILVDKTFWTDVIRFEALVAQGFIAKSDLDLIRFAVDGRDAWRQLSELRAVMG